MDTESFIVHVKTDLFTKILYKMLKRYLTLHILKQTDNYLKEKIKKMVELLKDELGGQIINEF